VSADTQAKEIKSRFLKVFTSFNAGV